MAQAGYSARIFENQTLDTTTNAAVYSTPFSGRKGSLWSLHYVWGGTPTSAITLWESNKVKPDQTDDTDWVQNSDVTFTNPAADTGKIIINVGNSASLWYRLKVVTSVSTGTFDTWAFAGKGS